VTAQLFCLLMAHATMAAAAIDYASRRPFGWPELLGMSYAMGMGATL